MTLRATKLLFALLFYAAGSVQAAKGEFVREDQFKVKSARHQIVIGGKDSGKGSKFTPEVRASFDMGTGKELYFLKLKRAKITDENMPVTFRSDQIRAVTGTEADVFHMEGDTLKWDVEYAEDPRGAGSGDFTETWAIEAAPGVSFHYQPPLTRAEIDAGHVRPDNVVGSYAVYTDKKDHFVDARGKTIVNYGTGKLAHIYRPFITDADGATIWGVLNISNGVMSVTIPGDFLDKAAYPVTLDPDLGSTIIGGSSVGNRDRMSGTYSTSTVAGVVSSLFFYGGDITGGSVEWTGLLYTLSDQSIIPNGQSTTRTGIPNTDAWREFTFPTNPNIVANTCYLVGMHNTDAGGFNGRLYYDNIAGEAVGCRASEAASATIPDPYVCAESHTLRFSIYATYTAAASGGGNQKKLRFFMRRAQ